MNTKIPSGGGSISLVDDWLIANSQLGNIVSVEIYDANSELKGAEDGCSETLCKYNFQQYDDGLYIIVVYTTTESFSGTIIK